MTRRCGTGRTAAARPGASLASCIAFVAGLAGCVEPKPGPPWPEHVGPITGIAVDASSVSVRCSQQCVELFDPRALGIFGHPGAEVRLALPEGRAVAVAALANPGTFVVGGGSPGGSGWVRLLAQLLPVGQDDVPPGSMRLLSWPPEATWVAATRVASDVVGAVACSRDGRLVAAGAADGTVSVWPFADGAPPRVVARHDGPCRAVAFLDDGTLVSGGRDGRLLWIDVARTATGANAAIDERLDHTAGVECLALGDDGSVGSGARDGRVRVHDAQRRLVRTWQRLGGSVLALLPDHGGDAGGFLAGTDDGRVLRLAPGREDAELVLAPGAPVHALARAGERLLVGTQQGLVEVPWPNPDVAAR